jgi:hypothetical protein
MLYQEKSGNPESDLDFGVVVVVQLPVDEVAEVGRVVRQIELKRQILCT